MVLAGVGSMSLNVFNGKKDLESVQNEVSNFLKFARNLAITKQLSNKAYNLKYVKINFSSNQVIIRGIDDDGLTHSTPPYSTLPAKDGITIWASNNFGFLKSNGQLTDNSGVATTMSVVVSVSGIGGTKTITINNFGIITNGN